MPKIRYYVCISIATYCFSRYKKIMHKQHFSPKTLDHIKAKISIEDLVGEHRELKPCSGHYVCPCLFHQEAKPSMHVYPDQGSFHCFGCQASGDIFSFVQKFMGVSFPEAVEILAEKASIHLDRQDTAHMPQKASGPSRSKHIAIHRMATRFYLDTLQTEGKAALGYLKKRGVSQQIIKQWQLGASPDAWSNLGFHLSTKYSKDEVLETGLVKPSKHGRTYDMFRNRLMFPIQDVAGNVLGFGARALSDDEDAKYINSSESDHFKKSQLLYGLNFARQSISKTGKAIMTEGYMDVLSLHQYNFTNSVGVLGTAFGKGHIKAISSFCEEIILIFDGDAPGKAAAFKAATLVVQAGISCRTVLLPDNEDADSLLQKYGAGAMQSLIDAAPEGLDFCLELLKTTSSPRKAIWWLKDFFAELKDNRLRAFYIPTVAKKLELSEHEFRQWEECKDMDDLPEDVVFSEPDADVFTPNEIIDQEADQLQQLNLDKHLLWGMVVNRNYLKKFGQSLSTYLKSDAGRFFIGRLADNLPHEQFTRAERSFMDDCHNQAQKMDIMDWYKQIKQLVA